MSPSAPDLQYGLTPVPLLEMGPGKFSRDLSGQAS